MKAPPVIAPFTLATPGVEVPDGEGPGKVVVMVSIYNGGDGESTLVTTLGAITVGVDIVDSVVDVVRPAVGVAAILNDVEAVCKLGREADSAVVVIGILLSAVDEITSTATDVVGSEADDCNTLEVMGEVTGGDTDVVSGCVAASTCTSTLKMAREINTINRFQYFVTHQ